MMMVVNCGTALMNIRSPTSTRTSYLRWTEHATADSYWVERSITGRWIFSISGLCGLIQSAIRFGIGGLHLMAAIYCVLCRSWVTADFCWVETTSVISAQRVCSTMAQFFGTDCIRATGWNNSRRCSKLPTEDL